jgi:prepilin-type processing-associated H-X9-DG protein
MGCHCRCGTSACRGHESGLGASYPSRHVGPGGSSSEVGNSPNHDGEGQNVLYADGHTEWQSSPYAGELRGAGSNTWQDHIYTVSTAGSRAGGLTAGQPADAADTVLLPTYR